MKLPDEVQEKAQLRKLQISCFKMINGLLAFTYIAILVWILAKTVEMITG
jgi:hypothetical protein